MGSTKSIYRRTRRHRHGPITPICLTSCEHEHTGPAGGRAADLQPGRGHAGLCKPPRRQGGGRREGGGGGGGGEGGRGGGGAAAALLLLFLLRRPAAAATAAGRGGDPRYSPGRRPAFPLAEPAPDDARRGLPALLGAHAGEGEEEGRKRARRVWVWLGRAWIEEPL